MEAPERPKWGGATAATAIARPHWPYFGLTVVMTISCSGERIWP